jgi:hypothetical protein
MHPIAHRLPWLEARWSLKTQQTAERRLPQAHSSAPTLFPTAKSPKPEENPSRQISNEPREGLQWLHLLTRIVAISREKTRLPDSHLFNRIRTAQLQSPGMSTLRGRRAGAVGAQAASAALAGALLSADCDRAGGVARGVPALSRGDGSGVLLQPLPVR